MHSYTISWREVCFANFMIKAITYTSLQNLSTKFSGSDDKINIYIIKKLVQV